MKWKKYNESSEVNEPVKIKDIYEFSPDYDEFGNYASDAAFLINEYINDQARKYYTNGVIPDDEEQEIRDALVAVYVKFEYWLPEDEDYEAGYEDGEIIFIIDRDDGSLCNIDLFNGDYPNEVRDEIETAAYKYLGVKPGTNCCPN